MHLFRTVWILSLIGSWLIASTPIMEAQARAPVGTGDVNGVIQDPAGAAVPNARINLTKTGSSVRRTAISDDDGNFHIARLPEGLYDVAVDPVPGFGKAEYPNLKIVGGRVITLEISLQIGAGQSVSITSRGTPFFNATSVAIVGSSIVAVGEEDPVRVWELQTGRDLRRIKSDDGVNVVAASPDGRYFVVGDDESHALVYETATGRVSQKIDLGDNAISMAVSPDGSWIAIGLDSEELVVWNVNDRSKVMSLKRGAETVAGVAVSADGSILASCGDATALAWDGSGHKIREFALEHVGDLDPECTAVAFSPDGRMMSTGSDSGRAEIWDVATRKRLRSLIHKDAVNAVAFSPDGRTLATASGSEHRKGEPTDHNIRIWNAATGRLIRTIGGFDGIVHAVVFTKDGRSIVSASADGTVRMWDVLTGRLVRDYGIVNATGK